MGRFFETADDELANFLAGVFHLDIDSPEQALSEYMQEVPERHILSLIDSAETFLTSNRSDQEKEEFIKSEALLYFPAIGLTPIQWLEQVIQRLKEAIESK